MIKLTGCFDNAVPGPRATSNTICELKNDKGYVVPTTTIYIKSINRTIIIPCGMKPYISELEELLFFLRIEEAIPFLIKKYNIPVPRKPTYQLRRYVYPTADKKIEFPIIQFNASYRVGAILPFGTLSPPVGPPNDSFIVPASYYLYLSNDDTKTFSTTVSEMKVNATYWFSLLTIPTYCIIRPTNSSSKNFITGYISYGPNDTVVFTVILRKTLYIYYDAAPENTNVTILYKSDELPAFLNFTSVGKILDYINNNILDF